MEERAEEGINEKTPKPKAIVRAKSKARLSAAKSKASKKKTKSTSWQEDPEVSEGNAPPQAAPKKKSKKAPKVMEEELEARDP